MTLYVPSDKTRFEGLLFAACLMIFSVSSPLAAQTPPKLPQSETSIAPFFDPSVQVEGTPNQLVPQGSGIAPAPLPIQNLQNGIRRNQFSLAQPFAEQPGSFGPSSTPGTLFSWGKGFSESEGSKSDEPLVTDRPDFTEASSTVGRGIGQLEFGYTYIYRNDGVTQTKINSFGEPLLRYGVYADWLELRFGYNFLNQEVNGVRNSGSDDLYLGFKIGLTPQEGILPEMALIPQMRAPTGGRAFRASQVLPGLNWVYGWELTEGISTAGSTQFNIAMDGTDNSYTEWAQSWTVALSLSDKLGTFVEGFGLMPSGAADINPEYYFNGGFTYLLSDNVQWDIRGGTGLNISAADYFLGSGFSVRFAGAGPIFK